MRRRTLLAAAAAALAIGLSGCGIPDETKVHDIGPGPEFGETRTGGAGDGPPVREAATSKEVFVANFLAAVAGEPSKVEERFRSYLTESAARERKVDADAGVNIVRVRQGPTFTELGQGSWKVKIDVDQVGVLDTRGSVGEATLSASSYEFKIAVEGTAGGSERWVVTEPPKDQPLMSTDALERYYLPHTIYFWSLDRTTLVPDKRYLPNELDAGRRPTKIVEWLVGGPSRWLESAVVRLNEGTVNRQNVPYPKDRLEVALTANATEDTGPVDVVTQLGHQLMWSLLPYLKVDLQLRIEGQSPQLFTKDQAFYAANAANRAPEGSEREDAQPERFALLKGKIYRLRSSPGGGTLPLPQLLQSNGVNEGIVSAAMAREEGDGGLRTAVALVVGDGGRYKLRLVTAVGVSAGQRVETREFATMGRAVWLTSPMNTGLVVADGSLYQFWTDRAELVRVELPGLKGKVVDVSAAPDGRRIAVAAGGGMDLFTISRDGGPNGEIEVKGRRTLPTSLGGVSAVDWSEETKLVAAGTGPDRKPGVWEMSLDGAIEKPQFKDTGGPVRHLVAYPDDPVAASISATVMYARADAAFNEGIEASELISATGDIAPSQVTAPFFLLD